MNIALFGGTFDPVHRGHLAVANAAQRRFHLHQILFVPAYISPLKQRQAVIPFLHRHAMLALATQEEKGFIPSLLEAPAAFGGPARSDTEPSYTIDTVHRLKRTLSSDDRLFFIIGIDAFQDITKWYKAEELLRAVDFIVASRPGYSLAEVVQALPARMRVQARVTRQKSRSGGYIVFGSTVIHLLDGVHEPVSATQVRAAAARSGRTLSRLVGAAVAEYIRKFHLYEEVVSG